MREDMFEIIIERPRWDSGRPPKGRRGERLRQQDAPLREPMSISRGSKCLNENLAPLRRFLMRRVGQPWDAVRSEICARIAPRSAVQQHVLVHVREMVEEHPVFFDGRPYHPGGRGSGREAYQAIGYSRWRGFYVCPVTRTLRVGPSPRKRRPAQSLSGMKR